VKEEARKRCVLNVLWEALQGPVVFKEKLHQSRLPAPSLTGDPVNTLSGFPPVDKLQLRSFVDPPKGLFMGLGDIVIPLGHAGEFQLVQDACSGQMGAPVEEI